MPGQPKAMPLPRPRSVRSRSKSFSRASGSKVYLRRGIRKSLHDGEMRVRIFALAAVCLPLLVGATPASAATKTETGTSGQTSASLTYDYKKTRFGTYDFSNLHVTITRAGVTLVDKAIEGEPDCGGCVDWPA